MNPSDVCAGETSTRRAGHAPAAWGALIGLWLTGADPVGAAVPWDEMLLPGGARGIAAAVGLDPSTERSRLVLEVTRRLYGDDSEVGDARRSDLLTYLADVEPPVADEETAPLPLPRRLWEETIIGKPASPGALFGAIVADRQSALLYHGLVSLDEPTLEFLSAEPALLSLIHREHAAVFATLGRSLHVHGGVVQVPGGAEAVPVWETLVGARVADAGGFVDGLLRRDQGRLAFLYDTVEHLDTGRARYVLGSWVRDAARARDTLEALSVVFATVNAEWQLSEQPFRRPARAPALLLRLIVTLADGRPGPPAWHGLWEAAFDRDDLPGEPQRELRALDPAGLVDSAWLAERIFLGPLANRRDRLDAFLFAQRVFSDAPLETAPDLLVTLRGFATYRTLMLTLERIGVAAPEIYAAAARHAARLGSIRDRRTAATSLAQFQACLSVVDRAHRRHTLDRPTARSLARSLIDVRPRSDGSYGSRIADWLQATLLPALPPPPDPEPETARAEATILGALAGPSGLIPEPIAWEGLTFRVDPAAAERIRLARIRGRQDGGSLDTALALCVGASRLAAAATLDEVRRIGERLGAIVTALSDAEPAHTGRREPPVREVATRSLGRLRVIRSEADVRRTEELVGPLVRRSESLLAEVLMSIVYAAHLGDPDGLVLLAGSVAGRHDFGLGIPNARVRQRWPWVAPRERTGGRVAWHMSGSLLGLDVGLARLALRRTGTGMPPRPTLNEGERRTFVQGLALISPFGLTDADRDAITSAISIGRARVARLGDDDDDAEILRVARDAGLSEWRHGVLVWMRRHEAERLPRFFSLLELFWLGQADTPARVQRLEAWGTARLAAEGCFCTIFPRPQPWEEYAGRLGTGLLATRVPDLLLRIAEALRALDLPAPLAPGILSAATLDFVDEVQPSYHDDWWALTRHAQALSRQRIEDYVASLVAGGPLLSVPSRDQPR